MKVDYFFIGFFFGVIILGFLLFVSDPTTEESQRIKTNQERSIANCAKFCDPYRVVSCDFGYKTGKTIFSCANSPDKTDVQ